MESIDKIVFGDNQFFGINHMSQDKAQQLSEKFHDLKNVFKVYDVAIELGIKAIMLNSNDRSSEICDYFRNNQNKYGHINWYPSIPYPHKYANLVAEKGIFPALNDILFSNVRGKDLVGILINGGSALLTKDMIKVMYLLIDLELKMFRGLNVKVIFLQNVITDLLLGFGIKEVFLEYCNYVRKKYNVIPGFTTVNLPFCLKKFQEWGIDKVVVCSSINKIGFTMSPSVIDYEKVIRENDPTEFQIMAMSVLASGAILPNEAFDYIKAQNIQSVVFGASSHKNIEESLRLLS
jgi:hypothetical protein